MLAVDILFVILGIPILCCATYLLVLSLVAREHAEAGPESLENVRFDIVVPAHNEEQGIAATVASLNAIEYPAELRRILVVADNCTDATAALAERAGATVLVRHDVERRGKGYALAHAFEQVEVDAAADAVVVIDADTTVSPNLLAAFARRFARGAHAVQADYAVRNPTVSWRTRLMVIALALFHVLRSLGRERLSLSAGLRGNGMGFSRAILRRVPHDAFSIVEDLEYGIKLGLAGERVHYVHEAHVWGEMVAGEKASRSQRQRWERGRRAIARMYGPKLVISGIRQGNAVLFDLGMDVLVPPLTTLTVVAVVGTALAVACRAVHLASGLAVAPWLLSSAFVVVYVLRGWAFSGVGLRGLLDLLWAPVYVVWKLGLSLRRSPPKKDEWVRTARPGERD